MYAFIQNLRYALRQLRHAPGFTLLAVLTLALGIGPATAVFAVFEQVLLREMPASKPAELVMLSEHSGFETGGLNAYGGNLDLYFAYPAYRTLRDHSAKVLTGLAAAALFPAKIVSDTDADDTKGQLVSGNYFSLLGIRPILGRLLTPEDDQEGDPNRVAVLGEAYWRTHFAADPAILDRTIEINGHPFTVVGVARHDGIMDTNQAALFVPITLEGPLAAARRRPWDDPLNRWMVLVGRVRPDVPRTQIAAVLNTAWWNWRRDTLQARHRNISDGQGWMRTQLELTSGARGISLLGQQLGQPVEELQAMALLVLLIACANLANLLLAKGARGRAQLSVHIALGASRGRIISQVVTEALLVGLAGTAAGLLLGRASLRLLAHVLDTSMLGDLALSAQWNWRVVLVAVGAGLATSLLFSVAPAVASARINPAELLGGVMHGQASVTGSGRARLRGTLVSGEIALCLLLLASATLFGWNLYQLKTTDPGFRIARVLTFRVDASAAGTVSSGIDQKYNEILRGLTSETGVQQAAYSSVRLLKHDEDEDSVTVAGYTGPATERAPDQNWISPAFFSTLNIPLLRGRAFNDSDTAGSQQVAIVDEAFVRIYYAGSASKALGGRLGFGSGDHVPMNVEIVGIVPAVHTLGLSSLPSAPYLYLPYAQTYGTGVSADHRAVFYISTTADPTRLSADVHALVHRVDRLLPLQNLATMQQEFDQSFGDTQAMAVLTMLMGSLALLLAAVGMYGVLAFLVAARRHEIGLRMAVGASRQQVITLVLRQVGSLAVNGMLAGALLTYAALRLFASRIAGLYIGPWWLYALPPIVIALTAIAAAIVPAQRAASVDPMQALRTE